jgi:predicted TIM-barrel fold metal-dependent hydrolase
MFIDIHAHAYWEPVPFVTKFATPEHLIEVYDKYGIEKGVLLPVVNPEIYIPQSNEDILNMAAKYPDRFIPFCNIDPRALTNSPSAPLDRLLQYYKDKGCKGVGEIMPNLEVMDPLVQNLFRCAEKVGLPVIFDGSDQKSNDFGLYDDPGLPQLEHTLQRYPALKVLGHGPVFWSEIARLETPGERSFIFRMDGGQVGILPRGPIREEGVVPRLFRRYPNLYGDLSDGTCYNALTRDEEYGPRFLEEFKDRLFFGTDYCYCGMDIPLTRKLVEWRDSGKISEDAFKKISRENAIRLLDL